MNGDFDLATTLKKPKRLFARRPLVYACLIIGVALAANLYRIRTHTLFACQADAYSSDRYISYCNGANYGDYEHGAFQFNLEPSAVNFARNADVMFLGNSRLQVAFSTAATNNWFLGASARYYLLGFSWGENVVFTEQLLARLHPPAKVYIINIDDFFERHETPPATTVFHDPKARERYESKRFWQSIHEPICKKFPALCGSVAVIFRSRETGAYIKRDPKQVTAPVSYNQAMNGDLINSDTAAAIDFLSHLPVERKCVILTMVPTVDTKIANASAVAHALGEDLVTPENLTDLLTFDGSHLDRPSAERWSQAFFQVAGPRIQSCLEEQDAKRL
jgi:hypothetical protein